MNKRTRNILTLILTISMILSNMLPVFGEEIVEDTVEVQSVNEEVTIDSVDDAEAHLDWVDITYPNGAGNSGLPNPFFIINDSEKGETVSFSRILNEPDSDSNILLVSFTNGYNENLALTAVNGKAKTLRVYNEGSVVASDNDPKHTITIEGYDGHNEEFLVNSNMFNITNEELNNLTLGELKEHEKDSSYKYYKPIPGLSITTHGYHSFDPTTNEEFRLTLSVSMDIVHDTYNPLNENDTTPQTWIRVRYTGIEKKEVVGSEGSEVVDNKVVPDWQKNGYKREFIGNDGDYIETVSSSEFVSKKVKPIVTLSYNGQTYTSGKGGKLVVSYKNNKNAGQATITLKKVKKDKSLTSIIKGKTITFEIAPITVSDNNLQTKIKNGKVKSVKVMTGNKMKKVSKKMWKVNGGWIEFSGNYTGKVSLNGIN